MVPSVDAFDPWPGRGQPQDRGVELRALNAVLRAARSPTHLQRTAAARKRSVLRGERRDVCVGA